MSTLSTHILDISTGRPAQGVKIALEREGALVARGVTDDNGRIGELGAGTLAPGRYRLCAEIASGLPPAGARRST
ncbi:transthyretin [Klebsiella michiganensis]|uniref:Transthyretin n=1 Tax=Klebsiella michiganensis TaxID=1134687 RepID=A0A7H4LVI4_9ENTR|nr:transthyretin [Klebsiella michiganensis]